MNESIRTEEGRNASPSKFSILIDIASAYELFNQRFLDDKFLSSLLAKENLTQTGKRSEKKKIIKSNPLCAVSYNGECIHTTKHVSNNTNPIWTIDTKSLFIFTTSLDEVLNSASQNPTKNGGKVENKNCLVFDVRSKKENLLIGSSSSDLRNSVSLGKISIPLIDLLTRYCTAERFEFEIKDEKQDYHGTLVLKFRFATSRDIEFVESINSGKSSKKKKTDDFDDFEKAQTSLLITEQDESAIVTKEVMRMISSGSKALFNLGKVAVKPHPDMQNLSETKFLTKEKLESQTFESPSTNWKHVGSGKSAKVYFEILACHDLPHVDLMSGIGDALDPFVTAIYEDGFVQTPVIQSEISPRWLPWTQRAFVFHVDNPTSRLYLGVSDFRPGLVEHENVGRAVINVANFKKDVVYTLKYQLFKTAYVTNREEAGYITVRLRIEANNERFFFMKSLKKPKTYYINSRKRKTNEVLRYTCLDMYSQKQDFDLNICLSYWNEISGCISSLINSIQNGLTSLIFWRGQVKIGTRYLPIYSALFFLFGVGVILKPELFPAMFFFSLAGIMLACMGERLKNPSPWQHSNSFAHFLRILLFNSSSSRFEDINLDAYEFSQLESEFTTAQLDKMRRDEIFNEERQKLQNNLNKEIEDINVDSKNSNMMLLQIDLGLMQKLADIQETVNGITKKIQPIKLFLSWEYGHYSFWVTLLFIILGIISIFLPVVMIMLYTVKLLFIIFFGPWMIIVDKCFRSGNDEVRNFRKFSTIIRKKTIKALMLHERAEKIKAFKVIDYGQYITRTPSLHITRFTDNPLSASSAKSLNESNAFLYDHSTEENKEIILSQRLHGSLIPRTERNMLQNDKEASSQQKTILREIRKRQGALKRDKSLKEEETQVTTYGSIS